MNMTKATAEKSATVQDVRDFLECYPACDTFATIFEDKRARDYFSKISPQFFPRKARVNKPTRSRVINKSPTTTSIPLKQAIPALALMPTDAANEGNTMSKALDSAGTLSSWETMVVEDIMDIPENFQIKDIGTYEFGGRLPEWIQNPLQFWGESTVPLKLDGATNKEKLRTVLEYAKKIESDIEMQTLQQRFAHVLVYISFHPSHDSQECYYSTTTRVREFLQALGMPADDSNCDCYRKIIDSGRKLVEFCHAMYDTQPGENTNYAPLFQLDIKTKTYGPRAQLHRDLLTLCKG